jgi:UDP-N-acetylmuramyl pentapeptide phosphotransferase/UDP-N-acetylglucosamine-1-phosphate transferase
MVVGLALTLVGLAAPVVDALTVHVLAAHLHAVYAGTGVPEPPATAITTYLVVVGVLGTLGWLRTIRAVRRQTRWARPVATLLAAAATAVAVVDLTVSEYGHPILPTWLGVLGLLPCLVGLVAVALLWSRTGPGAASPRVV